ncbi:hypothetical protein GCM10023149_29760 [Mucilaginibacter gynuensis]|uniref:beta-fructofuranosidase n=1 Tax=Mucilaginibacter gynuensis TaxID=1302236 RepID=A0ABP8GLZ9_9SPHI
MKRIKLFVLGASCLFFNQNISAQHLFHFEKSDLSDDGKQEKKLSVDYRGRKAVAEIVPALTGNGMRTDGYSTAVNVGLKQVFAHAPSVSGYFALETYPTDTAAFFSVSNKEAGSWISACIDKFGTPMIGIGSAGNVKYFPANFKVNKFRWLHIALNVSKNSAELWVNGKRAGRAAIDQETYLLSDTLRIARDTRRKFNHVFPVTAINGIVDEITLQEQSYSSKSIALFQVKGMAKAPDLGVPSSRFAGDFNRPKYHLLPAANWTNETHSLFLHNGVYHIFNQKNGTNLTLDQINWGHYTSKDLVSWTEQVPAITPDRDYDMKGIWSGHAVKDEKGTPVLIYTGGGKDAFTFDLAYPADSSLLTWEKYSGNPVVSSSPEEFERKDPHDPYVWREGNDWYMIIGFGEKDGEKLKGSLLLYKSKDLKKWTYLHPLFTGDPDKDDSGVFWEMPVFWKLNGKYILLVNKVPYKGKPAVALYWTGDFRNEKFIPDSPVPKRLEVINRLLSPSVNFDADGRTTAIAIIPDETSARATQLAGWTHLYSIPRVWSLKNDTIYQRPHPALETLRGEVTQPAGKTVSPGEPFIISSQKHQVEISVDLTPGDAKRFGFLVGKNPNGSEFSKIFFDLESNQLIVDQTKSTQRKFYPLQVRKGDYKVVRGKPMNLRLFIDGSVVEGFIDNKEAFTTRLFPAEAASSDVAIYAEEGSIKTGNIKVWDLKSSQNKTNFIVPVSGK